MSRFVERLDAHRRFALLAVAMLAAAGVVATRSLPASLFPRTTFPRVVVSAEAGERPADRMVVDVTRPLEEAVRSVPGVRSVRSSSSRGACDVSIDFEWGADMVAATLQVESAIGRIAPTLPPGFGFEARRMDPTVFPVVGLSLGSTGGRSLVDLRDRARFDLVPSLSTIRGVSTIGVAGGRSEEIQILVDPDRLAALSLTLEDVVRTVSAGSVLRAIGRLQQNEKLYLVLSDTQVHEPADLERLVVRSSDAGVVTLGRIAEVRVATAPEWTRVTADGRDAVLVNVYQQPDGDTLAISTALRERVAEYAAGAPPDLRIGTWYDQSELIRAAGVSLRDAILIGSVLAVGVLVLFLGDLRMTVVIALLVPLTLACTTLFLALLGMTLNLMTLGGMAASVGLVIDDAVVILEQVHRRSVETGEIGRAAALRFTREMLGPFTTASLATLVIFAPLAFLSGVAGAFFRPLAVAMATCLGVSAVLSLTVLPLMLGRLLRHAPPEERVTREARAARGLAVRVLRGVLERRRRLLLPGVVWILLAALAFRGLGSGFLPTIDEGGFAIDYRAPAGTSLDETNRLVEGVERILAGTPEVAAYSRRTGLALGGFLTEANEGDFFVRLVPPPRRDVETVIDDVREQIERRVPALAVELPQLLEDLIGDLTAVPQPIEVKLFGSDPGELRALAPSVATAVTKVPGAVDVRSGIVLAGDALNLRVDRTRAAALGLDPEQVSRLVKLVLDGEVVTRVQRPEKLVDVRVWTTPDARASDDRLRALWLHTADGRSVTLDRVTTIEKDVGQPQITRENMKTMVAVTARISGRDLGSAMRDVRAAVAALHIPPSVRVEYGGLYREQRESFRAMALVIGGAFSVLFLLLLGVYDRIRVPFAILGSATLAGLGAVIGLWLAGSELNISSLMGLTVVVGIAAEAAVFVVSRWRELAARDDARDPRLQAVAERTRPILMTALAAILALSPLALGLGGGSGLLRPLAIAIIGGLASTVPAVLVVLPAFLPARDRAGE